MEIPSKYSWVSAVAKWATEKLYLFEEKRRQPTGCLLFMGFTNLYRLFFLIGGNTLLPVLWQHGQGIPGNRLRGNEPLASLRELIPPNNSWATDQWPRWSHIRINMGYLLRFYNQNLYSVKSDYSFHGTEMRLQTGLEFWCLLLQRTFRHAIISVLPRRAIAGISTQSSQRDKRDNSSLAAWLW